MSIRYNEFGEVVSVNGLTTGQHLGTPMQDAQAERPEHNQAYSEETFTVTRVENTINDAQPIVPGGVFSLISVLDADPTEPKEGMIWILKSSVSKVTTPVIELGNATENSVEIKLSNASFDEKGAVVASYNIYVDGVLNKTENIEAGGTCVVTGLSADTEYQISVRGVKETVLSGESNVLTAMTVKGEPEPEYTPKFVILRGYSAASNEGNITINQNDSRSIAVCTTGKKACIGGPDGEYYPIPVPAEATSCTVVCPGFRFGYNGWNLSDENVYSYDVDSGWIDSGETYTFATGAAEYATIGFGAIVPEEAIADITITFA